MAEQISRGWTNADHVYTKKRTAKQRRQAQRAWARRVLQASSEDVPELPRKDAYSGYDD